MSTPIRIPVETRFPLDLAVSIAPIDALYQDAKLDTWSPESDIPWAAFDRKAFSPQQLDAARYVWSRRAWLQYTVITETPAFLLRFCLEPSRAVDAKYFLTVRNTEEAMLVECFHDYAELLGGYVDRPADPRWEALISRGYYRDALDAETSLDAYVAVHCAIESGLELELFRAYSRNAREPVARSVLQRSERVKARHAEFGWQYLAKRMPELSEDERSTIVQAAHTWLMEVALSGYHVPSLSTSIDYGIEERAQTLAAESGLGAATPSQEQDIVRAYLSSARARFRDMGLRFTALRHPRLGEL